MRTEFHFVEGAPILQDVPDTLVGSLTCLRAWSRSHSSAAYRLVTSAIHRTSDGTLLVAPLDDLLATKLKAVLDRAEAKDYRDIAKMITAGVSLPTGLTCSSKCSMESQCRSCV